MDSPLSPKTKNWVKINTDGSWLEVSATAAYGGIARNDHGQFLATWSVNLGAGTVTFFELWGVFWALLLGHNLGYQNIVLEMDFSAVFNLVQ